MNAKATKRVFYAKRMKKLYSQDLVRMAIIFVFMAIATLISLWMPAYFALRALQGF